MFLNGTMVGFTAYGINLPANFLRYKIKLFAMRSGTVENIPKIFKVASQPDFLFSDIQLLYVINQFLFKPVGVILSMAC